MNTQIAPLRARAPAPKPARAPAPASMANPAKKTLSAKKSLRGIGWLAAAIAVGGLVACGGGSGYDAAATPGYPPAGSPAGPPAGPPVDPGTGTGTTVKTLTDKKAIAQWPANVPAGEKRPVIVFTPGWNGTGNVDAAIGGDNTAIKNQGYVTLAIGFNDTNTMGQTFNSDLPQQVKSGLDKLCADTSIPANCAAIVITGSSYGAAQNYYVTEHVRSNGYSASDRKVVAFLSGDSGYSAPGNITDPNTGAFTRTGLANTANYSVAMVQRQGDTTFPIDSCQYSNCGVRTLAKAHAATSTANKVLSLCPPGGEHGDHSYTPSASVPAWDDWVIAALKTMLHLHQGVPVFTGYTAPSVAVSNACTS
jgi:hypothetical protein